MTHPASGHVDRFGPTDAATIQLNIEQTRALVVEDLAAISNRLRLRSDDARAKVEAVRARSRVLAHRFNVPARTRDALSVALRATSHRTHQLIRAAPQVVEVRSFIERSPLGLALAGLVVGALIGATLPLSELERESVGPLGDELVENAAAMLAANALDERSP